MQKVTTNKTLLLAKHFSVSVQMTGCFTAPTGAHGFPVHNQPLIALKEPFYKQSIISNNSLLLPQVK